MDVKRVAREGLTRTATFELRTTAEGSDGRTIDGYGAVFNEETEINSWEGDFKEKLARGAFKKSISERVPRMQFDHGRHPLIGSIPIGRWNTVEEDSKGLHVVGRISDNWLMEPVRQAIADGAVDGMSFRFSVIREEWSDSSGAKIPPEKVDRELWQPSGDFLHPLMRTLREVKVDEVGPVTWPAYEATSVGVRSGEARTITIDLGDLRSPATRGAIARAVFLADRANAEQEDTSNSDHESAVDHPSERTEEPISTDASSPTEHLSTDAAKRRLRFKRDAAARRSYLLNIQGDDH